jgi:hypothetical protein
MNTFTVGEEVLYDGERYVVSELRPGQTYQVRLLQTTSSGARMPWVEVSDLRKIEVYTRPRDDTRAA